MNAGEWLDGRYRIIRRIGEGGQGSVYLAIQERIYKFYAVKEVEKDEKSFSRESVELWKRLSHPGLPDIVDIVETEQKICLVMEYVEGRTLEEVLDKEGMPGMRKVIFWSVQICEILEYLHGQNPPIVFGDIKLSNLILQKDRIIMVDLGSAVLHSSRGPQSGTMGYLSPCPQARPGRDIYALGKCMERLMCGEIKKSSELRKILKKCLSEDDKDRYQTIQACRTDLEKLQNRPWMLSVMVLLMISVMALAGETLEKERLAVDASAQYEQLIKRAAGSSMKEQREIFSDAIEVDPVCETGYLHLLENFLEDSCLSGKEEQYLRELFLESRGDGICFEEKLKENQAGYGKVAWEMAMAYWYFYEGEGGRNYASQWFEKILMLPKEAVPEAERRAQSNVYAKIGSYRLALEHSDKTGESKVEFDTYWRDLMELFALTENQVNDMTTLYFWQELLVQTEHYHLEFIQAGVTEKEMWEVSEKIEERMKRIDDSNKVIQKKKEEIAEILKSKREGLL